VALANAHSKVVTAQLRHSQCEHVAICEWFKRSYALRADRYPQRLSTRANHIALQSELVVSIFERGTPNWTHRRRQTV